MEETEAGKGRRAPGQRVRLDPGPADSKATQCPPPPQAGRGLASCNVPIRGLAAVAPGRSQTSPQGQREGCHSLATAFLRGHLSPTVGPPGVLGHPGADQSHSPYVAASGSRQFRQQQNGCPLAPPTSEHQPAQSAQREQWGKLQGSPLPPQQPDNGAAAGRKELTNDITREATDGENPRKARQMDQARDPPPLFWEQEIGKEGQDPSTTHPTAPPNPISWGTGPIWPPGDVGRQGTRARDDSGGPGVRGRPPGTGLGWGQGRGKAIQIQGPHCPHGPQGGAAFQGFPGLGTHSRFWSGTVPPGRRTVLPAHNSELLGGKQAAPARDWTFPPLSPTGHRFVPAGRREL